MSIGQTISFDKNSRIPCIKRELIFSCFKQNNYRSTLDQSRQPFMIIQVLGTMKRWKMCEYLEALLKCGEVETMISATLDEFTDSDSDVSLSLV